MSEPRSKCTVLGMDVVPDDRVPDGQIWLDAPAPDGTTIRYMIDVGKVFGAIPEAKEKGTR